MDFIPEDAYDVSNPKGDMRTRITFSQIPAFDPHWIDFTLNYDGKTYPMEMNDGVRRLRELKFRATSEQDWHSACFEIYGSVRSVKGVLTYFLFFPVDNWKIDEKTDMTVRGEIDGQSFEIPFTFDPVKAHEEAVAGAAEGVKFSNEFDRERKKELEAIASEAVPIGIHKSKRGYDFTISEMAVVDGKLNFSWVVQGIDEKNPKLADMTFFLEDVMLDGMAISGGGSYSDFNNGVLEMFEYLPFSRDPQKLPDESLIAMEVNLGDWSNPVDVAFKYNWSERKVTLPKDEDEEQQWVKTSTQLNNDLYDRFEWQFAYDLKPLNLVRTQNGITMKLTELRLENDILDVLYEWERDETIDKNFKLRLGEQEMIALSVNGLPAQLSGSMYSEDDAPCSYMFYSPIHFSELQTSDQYHFAFEAALVDSEDEELYQEVFDFAFDFDLTQAPQVKTK